VRGASGRAGDLACGDECAIAPDELDPQRRPRPGDPYEDVDPAARDEPRADAAQQAAPGEARWLALRPEKILISKQRPDDAGRTVLRGIVHDLGYFGNLSVYRVELSTGRILQVSDQNRVRTARKTVEWDDEVFVSWDLGSAVVLSS